MADYGLKMSQEGYDVKTATNQQLSFSSSFNTFKVSTQGQGSADIPGGDGSPGSNGKITVNIAHGLGYAPSYLMWYEDTTQATTVWWQSNSWAFSPDPGYTGIYIDHIDSDSTNLTFQFRNFKTTTVTARYYYYIFYDSVA